MQAKKKFLIVKKISLLFFISLFYYQINLVASINCKDIFQFLYKSSGLKNILKENIFNTYGSGGINYRTIATTPIGLYYNNLDSSFNNISLNVFYLGNPNGIYFGKSNTVSALINAQSLVDLYNKNIINFLQNTPYASINMPFLSKSFEYINIINQRIGFIIQGSYELKDDIAFYIQLPFQWNIYYPSIPSELQGAISMEIAQLAFTPDTLENNIINNRPNSHDVIINHSVYDTFGLDKSVIGIYAKWCDEIVNTELRILLPGRDISQNNVGGNYENAKKPLSSLGIKKLLINILDNTNTDAIDLKTLTTNFLTGFDRVILGSYYNPLSYQPWGISPSIILHLPFGHNIFIDAYATYIYNFPQSRVGCGMKMYNNQFNNNINFEALSNSDACKYLDLFITILEQKLIPELCYGTFSPGAEYQASLAIRSTLTESSIVLGVDLWHQAQSQFLSHSQSLLMQSSLSATQCNGFFNFEYYTYLFSTPLTIGCIAQATLYAEGIGSEYGLKLQLTMQY